jgi:uncharacterized membrane protein HdeD (DUF308 family)
MTETGGYKSKNLWIVFQLIAVVPVCLGIGILCLVNFQKYARVIVLLSILAIIGLISIPVRYCVRKWW